MDCARIIVMIGVQVQHYLGRAREFLIGMRDLRNAEVFVFEQSLGEYRYSPALLAIHSSISYSDALRTGMGCDDLSSDDHRNAVTDLRARLTTRRFGVLEGTNQLAVLIGFKSKVEYSSEAVRANEIEEIVKRSERFARWAETTGVQLQLQGW